MKLLSAIFALFTLSTEVLGQRNLDFLKDPKASKITVAPKTFKGQTDFVFKDGLNREVSFRGFNMMGTTKSDTYDFKPFPDEVIANGHIEKFKKAIGGNMLRWLFSWSGVHKGVDHIDYDHIKAQARQIKAAINKGIFILIDFHQDTFSRHVGGANGAPKWIVEGMGELPEKKCKVMKCFVWSMHYFLNPAVRTAFSKFWKNDVLITAEGPRTIQEEYVFMLMETLKILREELSEREWSYIVGLDPMNEPAHGYFEKGENRVKWTNNKLWPFYQKIRKGMDDLGMREKLVFAEPLVFWNVRLPIASAVVNMQGPMRLKNPPKRGFVFNAHSYDEVRETYGPLPVANGGYFNEMELVRSEARKMNAPAILTEFGFWDMSKRSKRRQAIDIQRNIKATYQSLEMSYRRSRLSPYRYSDFYTPLISSTHWEWSSMMGKEFGSNDIARTPKTYKEGTNLVIERGYLRRAQGDLMSFYYNDKSKTDWGGKPLKWVSLKPKKWGQSYFADTKFAFAIWRGRHSQAPTEIFLPRHFDMEKAFVMTDKHVFTKIKTEATGMKHEVFTQRDSLDGGHRLFIFDDALKGGSYHFALIVEQTGKKTLSEKRLKTIQRQIRKRISKEENPLRLKGIVWPDFKSYYRK